MTQDAPSIATIVLNKYNGIDTPFPPVASKPKSPKAAPPIMTEGMLKNKEMLRNTLRVGIWTIEFTKVDGTPAVMECTLDPKFLPKLDPEKINEMPRSEQPEAEHLLHVYSTDRQGWRSFVSPNVTKIYKKVENQ
jgi:hypothetical protein